jgi:hypothetical protein
MSDDPSETGYDGIIILALFMRYFNYYLGAIPGYQRIDLGLPRGWPLQPKGLMRHGDHHAGMCIRKMAKGKRAGDAEAKVGNLFGRFFCCKSSIQPLQWHKSGTEEV